MHGLSEDEAAAIGGVPQNGCSLLGRMTTHTIASSLLLAMTCSTAFAPRAACTPYVRVYNTWIEANLADEEGRTISGIKME
jgi:hypothetical protein